MSACTVSREMSTRRPSFRRLPIRLRLTVAFAGVLAAVLVVGGIALYALFRKDFDQQINRDLDTRLTDVARLVAVAASSDEPSESRRVPEASGEGIVQVYGAGGRVIASAPRVRRGRLLTPAQVERATRGRIHVRRADTPAGEARLAAGRAHGTTVVVAVGEALARRDQALDRLRELLFIAAPLALLLATYAGYQVAGAALRPVERMRVRAERVTARDTSERLPVPQTGDEIEALGRTLNELLGRLDAALGRERRLLADASRELRTPLAVLARRSSWPCAGIAPPPSCAPRSSRRATRPSGCLGWPTTCSCSRARIRAGCPCAGGRSRPES